MSDRPSGGDRVREAALVRLPLCCFCGRRVLGLKGQDCDLARHLLADDESGRRIREGGGTGPAHVSCLVRSRAAADWAAVLTDAFTAASVPGARVDHDEGSVMWISGADDFRFVMRDGSHVDLSPGERDSALPMPGQEGRWFVTRTRNVLGSTASPEWAGVQRVLDIDERGGMVALAEFLDAVDVPVNTYDRRVVDTGSVTVGPMREAWRGKVVMGAHKRRKDVILVHHEVIVPAQAYEAARSLVPMRRR